MDGQVERNSLVTQSFTRLTCAIVIAYFVVSALTWILLPFGSAISGDFWPAAGLALGVALVFGRRAWLGLLVGAFASGMYNAYVAGLADPLPVLASLAAINAAGSLLQAMAGAWLISRRTRFPDLRTEDRTTVGVLLLGGPVASMVSPTAATLGLLWFVPTASAAEYLSSWLVWWAGNSTGVFVAAPLTLAFIGKPAQWWRGRRGKIVLPMAAVAFLVVAVLHGYVDAERRERLLQFHSRVSEVREYAESEIRAHAELLDFVKGLFDSSHRVTRAEFATFSKTILSRYPDITVLEWFPEVSDAEREAFEQRGRDDGFPNFQITEPAAGDMIVRASVRDRYSPTEYMEPLAGNEWILGFDVTSQPDAYAALDKARITGRTAASRPRVFQRVRESIEMAVFAPVYTGAATPATPELRRAAFRGAVAEVIHIPTLMANLVGRFDLRGVQVRLLDVTEQPQVLYESLPGAAVVDARDGRVAGRIDLGGRTWEVQFLATQQSLSMPSFGVSFLLVLAVFLAAGMFSTWLLATIGRHARTEQAVADRTEQLRKTLRAVEQNPSMIMITDGDGRIEYVNPKFTACTGYTQEEVLGKRPLELLSETGAARRSVAAIRRAVRRGTDWCGDVRARNKNGEDVWIEAQVSPLRDDRNRITHFVINLEDVSERRKLSEQLSYQARYDSLTGLVNRHEFERRLDELVLAARADASQHSLCFLDLDQFKVVNDTCGHIAGDELLRQIAALLKSHTRRTDTLARFGGDEFALLLERCLPDQAERIADQIREAVEQHRFVWESKSFSVGVSIGIVPLGPTTGGVTELMQHADAACYAAKDAGRNRIHAYRHDDDELARRTGEMHWVAEIHAAIERDLFRLDAQAIMPIAMQEAGRPHYEVLVRMRTQEGTIVPPGSFLSAAERYNLSGKIDRWVINRALQWLADHKLRGGMLPLLSINLSAISLADKGFLDFITDQIRRHGAPASLLCFELTETAAIGNLSDAVRFISTLKDIGCRFALDDFGSGLSSFAYLKNLPIDYLKIDGLFVKDIVSDPIDFALVRSINDVGHVMGKKTIAEYVENDAVLAKLRSIGVDYGQGFGLGRPRPIESIAVWDTTALAVND
jgi:diguanylate cyclase (GGDEF)-like protein/PAS domain S-box-containing protein